MLKKRMWPMFEHKSCPSTPKLYARAWSCEVLVSLTNRNYGIEYHSTWVVRPGLVQSVLLPLTMQSVWFITSDQTWLWLDCAVQTSPFSDRWEPCLHILPRYATCPTPLCANITVFQTVWIRSRYSSNIFVFLAWGLYPVRNPEWVPVIRNILRLLRVKHLLHHS